MLTPDAHPPIHAIVNELRASFPLPVRPRLLPGGEGRTYRAGAYVYRRETRPVEATYIADVYARLPAQGFRVPRPIRSFHGTWLTPSGWSAWTYLVGHSATAADTHTVLPAIVALHQALAVFPYPTFLDTKETPYTRAEQAAWGRLPPNLDRDLAALVRPLLHRRHDLPDLPQQLIHIDLNDTNILIAPGVPPALLDFTPSWRPAPYAIAVFAYWLGLARGHLEVLEQGAAIPVFDQLLLRVCLSKLILAHELRQRDVAYMIAPIERLLSWINQRTSR